MQREKVEAGIKMDREIKEPHSPKINDKFKERPRKMSVEEHGSKMHGFGKKQDISYQAQDKQIYEKKELDKEKLCSF